MKKCYMCGEIKDLDQFHKSSATKDGLQNKCKMCNTLQIRRWRQKNFEKVKQYDRDRYRNKVGPPKPKMTVDEKRKKSRQYYHDVIKTNPDKYQKMLVRQSEYQKNNRSKRREYERERYKNNIQARLAKNLRSRLYAALRGRAKNGSAVRDLGCTLEELKIHLESQFESWMTWDNHGTEWEIDHIKPLHMFDLEDREQLLEVCHYTNLRPLLAKTNRSRKYDDICLETC